MADDGADTESWMGSRGWPRTPTVSTSACRTCPRLVCAPGAAVPLEHTGRTRSRLLGAASRYQQRYVVPVEQDLVQLGDPLALRCDLAAKRRARGGLGGHGRAGFVGGGGAAARRGALFGHILEHHVDVVVEAAQRADNLLVAAHNDPHPRADALVDQPARAGRERLGRAQQAMEGRWAGGEAARHSLQREHLAHGRARSSRRDARAESQRGPAGASPGNVRSLPGKPTKPFLAANQTFAVGWSSAPFTEPHAWPRLVGVRHIHRRPPVPFQCILTHRPCSRLSGRQLPAVTRSRY